MKSRFKYGIIILAILLFVIASSENQLVETGNYSNTDKETYGTTKIEEFLNDDNLPEISVDSTSFKKDTLLVYVTDNYHNYVHDIMLDQMVSFIFADFSRLSTSSIKEVEIFYRTPKRDSNQVEYYLLHELPLNELKYNLRMYSNAKYRRIIDKILEQHKKYREDDILEKLNFYTMLILSEDNKIESQLFGYDFRLFLINLLLECETNNGSYYQMATERIFKKMEEVTSEEKVVFKNVKKIFTEGCNLNKEVELPTIDL